MGFMQDRDNKPKLNGEPDKAAPRRAKSASELIIAVSSLAASPEHFMKTGYLGNGNGGIQILMQYAR